VSEIRFRDAVRADRDTIADFQMAMADETEGVALDREVLTRGVAAVFDDPTHGRYFVAESDGTVVASLLITYEWSDWRNGTIWWIQSVYVRPDFRGRRVYTGLYDFLRARVTDDPLIRGIRLYVDQRNTGAQEVYKKLGMDGEHYQVFEWMK